MDGSTAAGWVQVSLSNWDMTVNVGGALHQSCAALVGYGVSQ